jgi:hypothetical protein
MTTFRTNQRGWLRRRRVGPHESSCPRCGVSLAIAVIWLSVLFDAIYGPDIVSRSYIGDFVSVPSAVVVAFFAFLATWVVARHGFGQERRSE